MKSFRTLNATAIIVALILLNGPARSVHAQSVTLEAESAVAGADFSTNSDGGTQFITITTDTVNVEFPGNANRMATFNVTFPAAGAYHLFARVRVGPQSASDDSLFYGNGFGVKSPTTGGNWIRVNNLLTGGFTAPDAVVAGAGGEGINVWKWVNLSQFTNGASETPITFTVAPGALTQTFQIGARENGLDMDKFLFGISSNTFTVAELDAGGPGTPPPPPPPPRARDMVNGDLIQFNDNGAWSWYMDERAVVDPVGQKLITGSDASGAGVGGSPRNGAIDGVVFDLLSGSVQRTVLLPNAVLGCDDHNAPAFMVRPDGKYIAQYAGHNNNFLTYFRIYNGGVWEIQTTFDWTSVGAGPGEQTSYSNPYYLSAENRVYSFVRCIENRSPHFLISENLGDTWSYGGQLVEPDGNVGYNSGYFRYSGNGVDRIDFICTQAHPRDIQTSMFHGYISNGMTFRSDGTVVDTNLLDQLCPVSANFQLVFSNGTVMPPGQTNYRCWNSDVQRYADGTVQAIIHARINQVASGGYPDTVDPNHAFFFCRYDGTNWTSTYLCQAGTKMYAAEADYVGLGALNPADPRVIYISTRYDPRAVQPGVFDTNQPYSAAREIWKGVTTNFGASFTWTPLTRDSVRDNFRPIVPLWDANHTALLWFRGTYFAAQSYDAAVVGLIERRAEIPRLKTYVDATTENTTLAAGEALVPGPGADQWHERTETGNGGSVLASADVSSENAPMLKTTVALPGAGTYDVWVNFWGSPGADWRIVAGLSSNQMQIFRQMASQQVESTDYQGSLVLSNANAFLYRAYLGRVAGGTVNVFVDDSPIQTGTVSTAAPDVARTWYDGVSYSAVEPLKITEIAFNPGGPSVTLTWNSVPSELSLTSSRYTVQRKNSLNDPSWTTLATDLPSEGFTTSYTDTAPGEGGGYYRIVTP